VATVPEAAGEPIENLPPSAQECCVPHVRPLTLDELDHRLLGLLQQDAGRPLHELGDLVGLSASAVQRRIGRYRAAGLLTRQVAILDPGALGGVVLAVVLVTLERESTEHHAEFRRRLLAVPEVQQVYDVAGEWDYVVVLVTNGMAHCGELEDRLFMDDPNIKRFDTLPVFVAVKTGLELPTRTP
jgi:Lrp/AsnC family transcriptional regulator, leucine-responsive regulatory protein